MSTPSSAEGATVATGPESRSSAIAILKKFQLPPGLFPLSTINEFGYNQQTGQMWMRQPAKTQQEYPAAEVIIMHHTHINGTLEQNRIKNLSGFKAKNLKDSQLFLSIPYDEIVVDEDELRLRSPKSPTRNFPLAAFALSTPTPARLPTKLAETATPASLLAGRLDETRSSLRPNQIADPILRTSLVPAKDDAARATLLPAQPAEPAARPSLRPAQTAEAAPRTEPAKPALEADSPAPAGAAPPEATNPAPEAVRGSLKPSPATEAANPESGGAPRASLRQDIPPVAGPRASLRPNPTVEPAQGAPAAT